MSRVFDYGGIRAGHVLCVRGRGAMAASIRWILTHDTKCYHNHNEPVLWSEAKKCLCVLVMNPPRARVVPLWERLAELNRKGCTYVAIEPAWLSASEHAPSMIDLWRSQVSRRWETYDGADYAERNIGKLLARIIRKFQPFGLVSKLAEMGWWPDDKVSFHCTQATLQEYEHASVWRPWRPPTLLNVSPAFYSPKDMENSIRADEWRYVAGNDGRELWQKIRNARKASERVCIMRD